MAGLSSLLGNLPSNGTMLRVQTTTAPPKLYVCDHTTEPPEGQRITTDQTNILIRALNLKKNKEKPGRKSEDAKGKRPAEVPAEEPPAKRSSVGGGGSSRRSIDVGGGASGSGASAAVPTVGELRKMTLEKLKGLLRAKDQPTTGKKEDLVQRLVTFHERGLRAQRPS